MDDSAHRAIIEPIDAIGIKKAFKAALDAEDVPASIDGADHNRSDHRVEAGTITSPRYHADSFLRRDNIAMLYHVRSLRHRAATVKEQMTLKRNLKAL